MKRIRIYTDGSCYNAHIQQLGGYGVYFQYLDGDTIIKEKKLNAGYRNTTNSRMEMLAICVALENIKAKNQLPVEIVSDSEFIIKYINNGKVHEWSANNFRAQKNPDLWRRLMESHQQFLPTKLRYTHTKGHGKGKPEHVTGNNIADKLADYQQFGKFILDENNIR